MGLFDNALYAAPGAVEITVITPSSIANAIRRLQAKGSDISEILKVTKEIIDADALKEAAETAAKSAKAKLFVIAYRKKDSSDVKTAEGVELPGGEVYIDMDASFPIAGSAKNLDKLCEYMASHGFEPPHITYIV